MGGVPLIKMYGLITDRDIVESYSVDSLGLRGQFLGVLRPCSEEEVLMAVREASAQGIKLTPQGLRSSLTGASIAQEGVALSLERMNRILDIDEKKRIAIVQPGVITADLRATVKGLGLMYPPDPTSQGESTIGGNVATNASGSKGLKYGSTRDWVQSIRWVDGRGNINYVNNCSGLKSSVGPCVFQRATDIITGSEGIYGIITEITLRLIRAPMGSVIIIGFFEDVWQALEFVRYSLVEKGLCPSAMEFLDEACIGFIRQRGEGLRIPDGANAIVYMEQEYGDEAYVESAMEVWLRALEAHTKYHHDTQVAMSDSEKERFYKLRHRVPESLNEESNKVVGFGGCKVATDWVEPVGRLKEIFLYFEEIRHILGDMLVARYGHIGNGHLHFNFIARNKEERAVAEEVEWLLVQKAVKLGGSVSGEHGIGKLKRSHLFLMYPEIVIESMRALKCLFDPKAILAPGNIL